MEFIPIEKYITKKKGKGKGKEFSKTSEIKKPEELNKKDGELFAKRLKSKNEARKIELKKVRNKYKETLFNKRRIKLEKRKQKTVPKSGNNKKPSIEEKEINEDDVGNEDEEVLSEEENENEEVSNEEENEDEQVSSEEDNENEEQNEEKILQEKLMKRRKELDEKKKNRLFIKLKKKIKSESQIKELHPDIRGVIFPRKKNSRWCWAVFLSEEKANEALKKLMKNKEIVASKPNPHEKVELKNEKKIKTVLRKKEARKKLQEMWM